jgi:hypothetical protein
MADNTTERETDTDDFARAASEPQIGLLREFWDFLRYEKKWWLTPIVVVLLLLGVLILLSASPAGPLMYTFW